MKRDRIFSALTAAAVGFLIAFGSGWCMITAFELAISLPELALLCAIAVTLGSGLSLLPGGGWIMFLLMAGAGWLLLRQASVRQQFSGLCYILTTVYDQAYGYGTLGEAYSGDFLPAVASVCGVIGLAVAGCVYRRRFTFLTVLLALIPLGLCLVVTNTVPAIPSLFCLLLGFLLLILPQSVRRRDIRQGARLTAILTVPAALILALLMSCYSPGDFLPEYQAQERLSQLPLPEEEDLPWNQILVEESNKEIPLSAIGPNHLPATAVMDVTTQNGGGLYLRGKDFDVYTGTGWTSSSRREAFGSNISKNERLSTLLEDVGTVTIETQNIHDIRYIPYYPEETVYLFDGGYQNTDNAQQYTYDRQALVLPLPLSVVISDPNSLDDPASSFFSQPITNPFPNSYYLELPNDTLRWAKTYLREALPGYEDQPLVTTATDIATLVRNSAAYDLNTSQMPGEETDFVRWFMEESDTGYCVHYASATAVLLRAAGIRARYVEGYRTNTLAGETVTVTRKNTHAWVEFYVPNYGWVILESTNGGVQAPQPAEGTQPPAETTQASEPTGTDPTETTGSTLPPESSVPTEPMPDAPAPQPQPQPQRRFPWGILWGLLLAAAAVLQWPLRLRWRDYRMKSGTPRQRMLKKWRFACYLARLTRQTPPAEIRELALRARFSQHPTTASELAEMDGHLQSGLAQLRARPWWQRIVFRLIFAAY